MLTPEVRGHAAVFAPVVVISFAGLTLALLRPGASRSDLLWAFFSGVVVMAVVRAVAFMALAVWGSRVVVQRQPQPGALPEAVAVLGYAALAAAVSLSLTDDPESAAYLSGFPVGIGIGALPLS